MARALLVWGLAITGVLSLWLHIGDNVLWRFVQRSPEELDTLPPRKVLLEGGASLFLVGLLWVLDSIVIPIDILASVVIRIPMWQGGLVILLIQMYGTWGNKLLKRKKQPAEKPQELLPTKWDLLPDIMAAIWLLYAAGYLLLGG